METLKEKLKARGLSNSWLVTVTGATDKTVSNWVTETTKPSPVYQKKIDEAFEAYDETFGII